MKLVSLIFLISMTLFSLGYGYKVNNDPVAHEQWAQPKADALASLQSEDFQKMEKDSLGMVITELAKNYNLQKENSNSRISELKSLINVLLVVLLVNAFGVIYWLYKTYLRKTI
jgi:hypothetical protein